MQHTCRGEIKKRGWRKTTATVSQLFREEGENMVYTDYVKQRIMYHHLQGHKTPTIAKLLQEEQLQASRTGILKRLKETDSIARKSGSGRPSKVTTDIKNIVEEEMQKDNETSAYQLHQLLVSKGYRCCASLGWTFRGSAYCQLIRRVNKAKRLQWAIQNQGLDFDDVVRTDECTVQLESHCHFCCRKVGQRSKNKPRYSYHTYKWCGTFFLLFSLYRAKHPVKVHIWAGISMRGASEICIFEGTMDKELFAEILDKTLVPYLYNYDTNWLMQDNNLKHTSHYVRDFLHRNGINWWKTPPESPDFNPIENLWHKLKEYIRREVKPKTKAELIDGIKEFWKTVTTEKCTKYIRHSRKVIPRAIELNGDATGYWNLMYCC